MRTGGCRSAVLHRRRSGLWSGLIAFGRRKERFQIRLDDRYARTVHNLHTRALADDARRTRFLEQLLVNLGSIMHRAAQASDAAVYVRNIRLTAQTHHNLTGQRGISAALCRCGFAFLTGVHIRTGVQLDFAVVATRRLVVELLNHEREHEVVNDKIYHADDRNPQPAGLGITLHDAEQRQVDKAAGEGQTNAHIEYMHNHVGRTCEYAVHHIHRRGDKQEGKFQRLRDTGQHRGQCGRQQQTAHRLTVFRLGTAVQRKRCARQAENHQRELTGHKASRLNREMLNAGGCQLGKEDILRTLYQHTVDHSGAAQRGLPEGDVEHVMQAERNERALDKAIQPGAGIAGGQHKAAQRVDAGLNDRPDVVHRNANDQINRRRDNRHKACAAEKAQHLRQLNFVILIVQRSNAQADDDTAEYTHLQRVDAQHARGRTGQVRRAEIDNQCADGGVHDKERNRGGQCRNFFLLLGHTDGDAHRKDNVQIVKDNGACRIEHLQNCIDEGAGPHNSHQAIGFQHGFIGERSADAEEQTGNRKNGNRQHKRSADALQYAKNLIFHILLLLLICNSHRYRQPMQMNGQKRHLLGWQLNRKRFPQLIPDFLRTLIILLIAPHYHALKLRIIVCNIAVLRNPLSEEFKMCDKPTVVERLLIQRHAIIILHHADDLANQLGDTHHIRHFTVNFRVDDVECDEPSLILRQPKPQSCLDDIDRLLANGELRRIKVGNLPQQMIRIANAAAQSLHSKADVIGERNIDVFAQPTPDPAFRCLDNLRTDIQKFRRYVRQQIPQSGGFLRITQIVNLFHLLRRNQVSRMLFKPDTQSSQNNLFSAVIRRTNEIVADHAADAICTAASCLLRHAASLRQKFSLFTGLVYIHAASLRPYALSALCRIPILLSYNLPYKKQKRPNIRI